MLAAVMIQYWGEINPEAGRRASNLVHAYISQIFQYRPGERLFADFGSSLGSLLNHCPTHFRMLNVKC
jgi:hypothetical protein